MLCPSHKGRSLEIYCKQCEKLICEYCMKFDEHSKHECEYFEKVAKEEMEDLRASLGNCEGALSSLDEAIAKCNQTMQKVETRKTEVDTAINNSLEQVRKALLAQNEGIRSRKVMGLKAQVNELQRIRDGLSHAFTMITAAKDHSPVQQLSTKKALAERAAELKKAFEGSKLVPSESDTFTTMQERQTPYTSISGAQQYISTNSTPYDVAVSEEGHLAVAEHGSHTVTLYSKTGQKVHMFGTAGSYGTADGQFHSPSAVAIKSDLLYVCESGNNRVQKFSISQQSFISKFGTGGQGDGQFSSPYGICIDPEGNVFIADYSNHRIQVFRDNDSFAYSFPCQSNPWGLAFDLQGHLHVTGSSCINVYTPEGNAITSYGSGTISSPTGIAIDAEGYIAISQNRGNKWWLFLDLQSRPYSHSHTLKPVQFWFRNSM